MNEQTATPTAETPSKDFLQQSKSHAMQAADELRQAAALKAQQLRDAASTNAAMLKDKATETAQRLRDSAQEQSARAREVATQQWQNARTRAQGLQDQGEVYIRENPTKAVLAALGIGFVLGLVFRR